jgi:REP element-mobilizing transposase RayT
VSHRHRAKLASRHPVHVTLKLERGLPRLRNKASYRVLRRAFVGANARDGFRLCEYSVQGNHIHLIVEAKDRPALSRGMQGLAIRIALGLNRLWERTGRVFADRYHDRILRTPREVRNALSYVLNNARRHRLGLTWAIDLFSSGPWFGGWKEASVVRTVQKPRERPTAQARSWLLQAGWRRHGLIRIAEVPGG